MPTVKALLGRDAPPRPAGGFDVVGFGQNALDTLVEVPDWPPRGGKRRAGTLRTQPGGQVATAMVAVARLGLRAAYLGCVGDDEAGRAQLADLAREGVDASGVVVVPGTPTQFGVILVEPDGARTILWGLDDALVPRPEQVRTDIVRSGRVLHLDGTGLEAAVTAARAARDAGLWVSLDVDRRVPGDEALLALCDIVVASEEIGWLDAPLSGVTLGERGAALRWPGGEARCPAPAVEAVDTTGCGDVFRGALLAAALEGGDVKEVLRFACAAAALKTRRAGGRAGIPGRPEVLDRLAR